MAGDDEDWFERALREDDATDSETTAEPDDDDAADDSTDVASEYAAEDDTDPTNEDADTARETGGEDAAAVDDAEAADDFAAAFDAATDASTTDSATASGFEDASDGERASEETFGFDLDDADSEGTFGFDFDDDTRATDPRTEAFDEEFDSAIPRIDLGIDGLDAMVQGGVPERSLIVAIGSAGTGKTTFGLQFLNEAIENGERAVYITLEETHERIVQSATEKGWPFDEYIENDQLAVVDLDPVEMANSLKNIRSELPLLIEEFGASRLVLDSVSLLEMMYDDQADRRIEIYDFTKALKRAGVTTMLTSEASDDNPFASRYGIIEYLTDAVIVLRYVRPEDFRETRLAIEIQKIRDANHSRETKPYEITGEGISVYKQANIF